MVYLERFIENIKENNLIVKGDKILIALSGGPDSMFLLHLLEKIKNDFDLEIIVVHIDHDDREGTFSDAIFVKKHMEDKNIKLEFTKFDLSKHKGNLHDVGRTKRYDFLYEIAKKYKVSKIAFGHHSDDLIETVLFRLSRGSSISGYGGIRPKINIKNFTLIRPLLIFDKDEILKICQKQKISYVTDPTNFSHSYVRNRIRHDILPIIKNEFKNVGSKYLLFSNRLADCTDYAIKKALEEVKNEIKIIDDDMFFYVENFKKMDKFVQEQMIYYFININTDYNLELNFKHIEQVKKVIFSDAPNLTLSFPNNYKLIKEYDKIKFVSNKGASSEYIESVITGVGSYKIANKTLVVEEVNLVDVGKAREYKKIYFLKDDIQFPIKVRFRENGDSIIMKSGRKKLKKLFIDNKIPVNLRDEVLVLVNGNKDILWVDNLAIAKNACMKNNSNKSYYSFSYIYS